MMEEVMNSVQNAIQEMIYTLDREGLRKMQGDMHKCAASCCYKEGLSMKDVQKCITDCSNDLNASNEYLTQELSRFQSRLERCTMQCQDDVKDRIIPNDSPNQMDKYKAQFEKCVSECGYSHLKLIPTMTKRIKHALISKNYN